MEYLGYLGHPVVIGTAAAAFLAFVAAFFTRRLKISEFRQTWINDLRKDIADYLGTTQRWFHARAQEDDELKLFAMGNEANVILYRIKMRLNPNETEHNEFIAALEKIRNARAISRVSAERHWGEASEEVLIRARKLLKREWETTKRIYSWRRP